ncbi:hypothetical protein MKW94_008506 [Papaver nudicaule]|uniref:phosphatidylglycerophosphatase n=1 Tax=Papaver nudicaule TaxID=74823 RepID=A0AA42B5F7_PAPNU|nr:hypothetical protein [Papaver nudicaule]
MVSKERLEDWEELENELEEEEDWENLDEDQSGSNKEELSLISDIDSKDYEAKRVLVGAGARILFYPTLMYNVVRNKMQPDEFHWWDQIDQFVLLGAVPFTTDVPRLKELGVQGVVTLNEPYETLVPSSLYHDHGIDHLVIPTRDYLFAPSHEDLCQAVDFIHNNVSSGKKTYVHCKAGRGRSTTVVLCYLVQTKQMTPAVQDFYNVRVVKDTKPGSCFDSQDLNPIGSPAAIGNIEGSTIADGSIILVTESDLDGYDSTCENFDRVNNAMLKLSKPWLRKTLIKEDKCSVEADKSGGVGASIKAR